MAVDVAMRSVAAGCGCSVRYDGACSSHGDQSGTQKLRSCLSRKSVQDKETQKEVRRGAKRVWGAGKHRRAIQLCISATQSAPVHSMLDWCKAFSEQRTSAQGPPKMFCTFP